MSRKMKFTGKPLYVRTDEGVRNAIDRLLKHARGEAGVADIVRSAIIEKAERDLPQIKKREYAQE